MSEFQDFLKEFLKSTGTSTSNIDSLCEEEVAGLFLNALNRFLYQRNGILGKEYISRFHRYWKEHHQQILQLKIDDSQCQKIAEALEPIYAQPEKFLHYQIRPPLDRVGIPDKAVANVRFFTAIQDFKINIHKGGRNPFEQYNKTPKWFTASEILNNPDLISSFLGYLEATGSQGDKRTKWMLAAAQYLVEEHQDDAFNIFKNYRENAGTIREELASRRYLGYSYKKADMFLRDMAEWGIWSYPDNAHLVNVASDANTMRIALRTGIVRTAFPLLASYLDVYCYQYGAIDTECAKAWRRTWELWAEIDENHRPATPASMDYLLYQSIGKKVCRPTPNCSICLFNKVCPENTRNLNPPKSISQKGMTGWDSGATNEGGGGGIMS